MALRITLPYGRGEVQEVEIDEEHFLGVLEHRPVPPPALAGLGVDAALAYPVGSGRLRELVGPGEQVVVVTSDITRPFPSREVLPAILWELAAGGVRRQDISVVLAIGNHRFHTEAEKVKLVGEEIYKHYRVLDADGSQAVPVGATSRGTPLEVFAPVVEADRRVLLGNVEYHYFAGYSGGVKALVPGCASHAAIQSNHGHMVEAGAEAGSLEHNPVRQDLEEILNFLPVDFILNVVLDENKKVLAAYAGHPIKAHRQAAQYLDAIYRVEVSELADIVIASAGGYPKDINLYQAQKAIDNAWRAVRPGGILILVAQCPEGLGDGVLERWAGEAASPDQLITRAQTAFELGGHKAAAIAMVAKRISIFLVSELDPVWAQKLFLAPFSDLAQALVEARHQLGPQASILVIPQAGSVLPQPVEAKRNRPQP